MPDGVKLNPSTLYDRLRLQVSDAEFLTNALAAHGDDPGHAQAAIQLVIAKALIDIAESLDSIRKSAAASVPNQLP